jgi:hypothetical protein
VDVSRVSATEPIPAQILFAASAGVRQHQFNKLDTFSLLAQHVLSFFQLSAPEKECSTVEGPTWFFGRSFDTNATEQKSLSVLFPSQLLSHSVCGKHPYQHTFYTFHSF